MLRWAWRVSGVLHDVAGSWRVLGRGGGELAGGGVLRAVSGWRGGRLRLGPACHVEGAWRVGGVLACVGVGVVLGLACRVEAAWRVGGVLACRVGSARWVGRWWGGGAGWRWFACMNGLQSPGSCAVLGRRGGFGGGGVARQDGGGSHAQMGCNLQGLVLCWGGEVGWRWWGVGAGWRWLACTNGGFACHVGAAGWWWWRVVSHVGAACWGRDEWKRLACTRGRQWPAMLKVSCGDGPRGITAWW
ncbi:hypothetical protein EDB89DRAFT_1901117 [Lactarius sanguifluus]|nr:hypothetical protein EDB89DRAFT_1901117 [Lactarius sanguifluus]